MNWLSLFIGILVGWLIEWIIDVFYWRRRTAGSRAAGTRLSTDAAGFPAGGDQLAAALRQSAESERLLHAREATVNAQATEIAGLQARLAHLAELEQRLAQCEGDLGVERAEVDNLQSALAAARAAEDAASAHGDRGGAGVFDTGKLSSVESGPLQSPSGTAASLAAAGALPAESADTFDWAEAHGPRRAPGPEQVIPAAEVAAAEASSAAAAAERFAPAAAEAAAGGAVEAAEGGAPPATAADAAASAAVWSSLDQAGGAQASGTAAAAEAVAGSAAVSSFDTAGAAEASGTAAAAEEAAATAGSAEGAPLLDQAGAVETSAAATAAERSTPAAVTPGTAASGTARAKADDLEIIEGIGPKIAALLRQNGISTFAGLAAADVAQIQAILRAAGPRFQIANPATWAQQAALAAAGKWDELKALQDRLTGGLEEKRQ